MLSLKTIILKYLLVCVFLVSPCCEHRDRRPDLTVSVVPSPRFVLFVFSSVFFVPGFLSLLLAVRGSLRRRSRLSHPAVRGTSCPPFAGVYAAVRGSPIPLFAGVLAAVRGSAIPPFAGVDAAVRGSAIRRSREFTPPFADQPALSSLEMTPPSTANPSRRPASDSMPAGLPLTQCPPACLWFQLARSAADSSSPDCRWLKLAGLPLTHATGRWQGKPIHFRSSRRRLRLTDPAVRGRSRRRPWGKPTHRRRLPLVSRGKPTRRPRFTRPAAGCGSLQPAGPCRCVVKPAGCCHYLSSQPIMVSPDGRCRIDKPAGRGRIWPDSDHGLFNCLCVFSPGGLLVPLSCPMVIFWGGYKGPGCCGRAEGRGHGHHGPPALASWAPCSTLPPSVCSTLEAPSCVCIRVCPEGSPECPPPLPVELLRLGSSLPGGGVMLEICRVCLVFPASCFHIWLVACRE